MESNRRRDVKERFSRIRITKAVTVTLLLLFLSSIIIVIGFSKLSGPNAEILTFYVLYAVPFLIYLYTIKKYDLSGIAIFEGSQSDLKQVWFFIPLIIMTIGVVWMTVLLLYLVSSDLAAGYFNWLNSFEPFEIGSETTFLQYGLLFFSVAVFAPVVEEIIFRGIMIERFGSKYGYKVAVLLSSFFFGVLHMDIIGAFFFGVVLSVLYLRTRSLLLPFLIHAANNGAVMLLIFFEDSISARAWDTIYPFIENTRTGVLLFAVSFGWLAWFLKNNWRIVHESEAFPLKTKEEIDESDE